MIFSNGSSEKPINILKASLPYIPATMQRTFSYFVKIEEFELMIHNFNNSFDETLSACSSSDSSEFNIQGLFNAIKPYLNDSEKELINMFYNFMNAMNVYNVYRSMPDELKSNFNFNSGTNYNSTSQSQPEKKDYFFNTQPENITPDYNAATQSIYNESIDNNEPDSLYNSDIDTMNHETLHNNERFNSDIYNNETDYNDQADTSYNSSSTNSNGNYNTSNDMNFNNSSSNNQNNNINIESLKALLTPNQRAMFETYSSMLNMK